jgi:hypothetical protein
MGELKTGACVSSALVALCASSNLAFSQVQAGVEGVWSTTMTMPDDEAWRVEDHGCFLGCPSIAYERLRDLLSDPANDELPYEALMVQAWQYGAEQIDTKLTPSGRRLRDELGSGDEDIIACEPMGIARQVLSPLPMKIEQLDDRVIVSYEEWGVERTVYMDGRGFPEVLQTSPYGYSIGRYEGSALVIETRGVPAGRYFVFHGIGGHSERLQMTERYTWDSENEMLHLELIYDDSVNLNEPIRYEKVWRSTPDVEFLEHDCETISGQF